MFVLSILPDTLTAAQVACCDEVKTILGFKSVMDVAGVFALPFAIAVAAPWATKLWEARQRDSQTKTQLVSDISELVMTTVMTVHLFNRGELFRGDNKDATERELDNVYRQWSVKHSVINSKLHAYFPQPKKENSQIHKKWGQFSEQLGDYYKKSREMGSQNSQDQLKQLNDEKEKLFEKKAELIEGILASRITGFPGLLRRSWTWLKRVFSFSG